jgi:hypothetical protein
MPEIHFSIDPTTGELQTEVKGVLGPACDEIARLTTDLLGEPAKEIDTVEYRLRAGVRPQIRGSIGPWAE